MPTLGDSTTTKAEIRAYVRQFDVRAYAKTRNQLSGNVSKLSPYLTRGMCSLPEVAGWVLEQHSYTDAEKFIQELAWREYWQQVWWNKGAAIFSDMRFVRTDWEHTELVHAIIQAETGIAALDTSVQDLYRTGYMHNQARLWVAMLASNIAKAHWYNMSRWLYYHLLDGDLASTMLSWQWVAGTNAGKRHYANQATINVCAGFTQVGTYLDHDKDTLATLPVPTQLAAHSAFTYKPTYPQSTSLPALAGSVFLYSPWTLDPDWRSGEAGVRILVIEPRWFDRFPVSALVMTYLVEVAKVQVPEIRVFVGNIDQLPLTTESTVYSRAYPLTADWPGQSDQPGRLFPEVSGYYSSFFKFWEACQKTKLTI